MKTLLPIVIAALLMSACTPGPEHALGTLERDRITLPAPVSERIAEIAVREGQTVATGDTLLVLEPERTGARLDAARAEAARLRAARDEAQAGPRSESIAEARARVRGAEGVALNARRDFERVRQVVERRVLPAADLDRARANLAAADADAQAAREALALLEHGTRGEQIVQAEAALAAAEANVTALQVDLARTRITAPRAGQVDSLPFEVGDQVPVGTPLAVLLVGDKPYARVYVPQPLRASVRVGTAATVHLQGTDASYPGHVRAIRSEPSFTPYYALAGEDASRLSWLAEIELDAGADSLPVGIPVRAEFAAPQP
ncbi:HlyD family secretion protein [Arenimonas terrae]|uniref:HlyD family efflux transporter periplasmic adaptor subunit n=1 Tax=Arenimonas terrae TaxID=2546226 RepID=A0A5C4RW13_9GAMM|nr:HlyD family efflux transporter periplasmic adaptor subunit [Arenimonas terrae]TNJ35021.1 HlyD family efflux transporter periplasmic adaptor subunit [Arenimonas terrae]